MSYTEQTHKDLKHVIDTLDQRIWELTDQKIEHAEAHEVEALTKLFECASDLLSVRS